MTELNTNGLQQGPNVPFRYYTGTFNQGHNSFLEAPRHYLDAFIQYV